MKDIFISHVEEDAPVALALADLLEGAGFTTWCYERDSLPGISYLIQTGQAVEQCKAVLLVISDHALGSHQVTKEVVRAHESERPIIPLLFGVSHAHFQKRQPEWREVIGAAASLPVSMEHVDRCALKIIDGLKSLGIVANPMSGQNGDHGNTPIVIHAQPRPAPEPERAHLESPVAVRKPPGRKLLVLIATAGALAIAAAVFLYSTRTQENKQLEWNGLRKQAIAEYMGSGGKIREKEAWNLFSEADSKGDPLSHMWLARGYHSGRLGLSKDSVRAAAMAREVLPVIQTKADKGEAESEFLLASAYEEGIGVDRDGHRAADLFSKSCGENHVLGCNNLGSLYAGGESMPKDEAKAAGFYRMACDAGDLRGCTNLGFMYGNGFGVPRDAARAAALFENTCQKGDLQGCTNLGFMYDQGEGIQQDSVKAASLYGQACNGGNMDGCVDMAAMQFNGHGIPKDEKAAIKSYKRACDGGSEIGCEMLKKIQ